MPTGYTHKVQTGEMTELKDFALYCAKAFGACITMRDHPIDSTIPDEFKPDIEYYEKCLKSADEGLNIVYAMSDSECTEAAVREYESAVMEQSKRKTEKAYQKMRYEDMIHKVRKWNVPNELAELKSFMLTQLVDSLKFDCDDRYPDAPPQLKTRLAWKTDKIFNLREDIERYKRLIKEEIERAQGRNEWIKMLRDSLKEI